jgi:hypothetical protein
VLYDLLFRAAAETLLEVAADPKHLALRSGSWPSCIPGDRTCFFIPISTASFPPAGFRSITVAGCIRAMTSSCHSAF